MLLSEWRKTAPNRECMSNSVLDVLKPVLADLGADGDPSCWVIWGEDPEYRYSIMAPTPILRAATSPISDCFAESALGSLLRRTLFTVVEHLGSQAAHSQNESQQNAVI